MMEGMMNKLTKLAAVAVLAVLCAGSALATDYAVTYGERGLSAATVGPYTLQSAATTGNGNTLDTKYAGVVTIVNVKWSSGCSAGVLAIEQSPTGEPDYSGTWSALATVSWTAASKLDTVVIAFPVGVIRARVSTTVTGGTVTVTSRVVGR